MMYVRGIALICLFSLFSMVSHAAPASFVFQGQILKPNGESLEASSVDFTVQILSDLDQCLLHEETFTINMSNSSGIFNLSVGTGTNTGNGGVANLAAALDNSLPDQTGLICTSGSNYDPAAGDSRRIRLTFNDGSGPVTLAQDHTLESVPYAQYAGKLEGKAAADFIQVNNASAGVTQSNIENVFDNAANYTELLDLLAGTSLQYQKASPSGPVDFNGQVIDNIAAPVDGDDATNKNYVDANIGGNTIDSAGVGPAAGDGKVLMWDQANNKWVANTMSTADATKLPLAGGTMSGDIDMGGNDILAGGYIIMNGTKYLQIGRFTDAEEAALVATPLTAGHQGASWFNTTSGTLKYWDGAAVQVLTNSAGTVSDVTASAPLASSGGTTPDISINIGNGLFNNAGDLAADIGTGANQVMGSDAVPNCLASEKLEMSSGPVYTWSCVADVDTTLSGAAAGGDLSGTYPNPTIANDAVTTAKILNDAVTTAKILDGNVTGAKLENSGVTAGTYPKVTVDAKGRVTSGASLIAGDIPVLDAGKITTGTLDTARIDVGTGANQIVQLDGTSKLPAVDGSQLTNLPVGSSVSAVDDVTVTADNNGDATGDIDFIINATTGMSLENNGNFIVDTNSLFVDATANRVGIGTVLPSQSLDVQGGNINASGDICSSDGTYCLNTVGAAAGEANTVSNQGAGGVGMFKQKTGVDLEFKNINAGSNKVTVTDDAANNEIDIDIAEANIDHDALSGFVANEHVDHSSVSVATAAGTSGLSGGGDLTATRNLVIDIFGTGALGAAADNADSLLIYDDSATALKKVTRSELVLSEAEVDAFVSDNGYATAVTATAPLASSGGTTPDISLNFGGGLVNNAGNLEVDVGTGANQIVQLDGTSKLPAVDGSQLTNLPAGSSLTAVDDVTVTADNNGDATGDIDFIINATTGMSLENNGNLIVDTNSFFVDATANRVGIGTVLPSQSLDVQGGNINASGDICSSDGTYCLNSVGAAAGQNNTASNQGAGGVGVYKQKTGVDLEFRSVNAGSSKVTVTDDAANNEIDIDIAEANIDHDSLSGFVADEHVDHSGVSIGTAADSGLSGGGDITASRSLAVDIAGATSLGAAADGADTVLLYDSSATALKKVTRSELVLSEAEVDAFVSNNGYVTGIDGHSLDAADGTPVDAVYVDNDGKVGVGTAAPVEKLHVSDDSGGRLALTDSDYGSLNDLVLESEGGFGRFYSLNISNAKHSNRDILKMNLNTGASEFGASLLIKGQVAINSDSDTNVWKIDEPAVGQLRYFVQDVDNNSSLILENQSGASIDGALIVKSDGKVGVGTVTPGQKLDVQGGNINASGDICSSDGSYCLNSIGASAGQNNTASNQGVAGVGVFDTKSGVDLQFRNINAGSNKVTVALDGNKEIDIDIAEANIDHDALSGFVANEHVDHSSVDISTGANSGLSGGGDLTATRNIAVDISGTGALGAAADNADSLLLYDDSATALKKVTRSELVLSEAEVDAYVSDNGYTTAVTASAPLASSGGTTPDISISLGNGLYNNAGDLDIDLDTDPGLEFNAGKVRVKAGSGITRTAAGINADVGTGATQVMGADAVPNCLASEKLQMSAGPVFTWSCVNDQNDGLDGSAAGGDLAGTYPNPTIATDAVTTTKILDGAVTGAKLENSGVTVGTYPKVTVDAKGRVTTGASLSATDIPALDAAKVTTGTFDAARVPNLDAGKITSGTIGVANGGTGASTAGGARTNLGLEIGTDIQAYDADLVEVAGLSCANGKILGRVAGAWTCVDDSAAGIDGHSLDAADGNPVDALYVENAGNVGVGTTSATERFEVEAGNILIDGAGSIDPLLKFSGTGGVQWSMGMDDASHPAGGDAFVIANNDGIGANERMVLSSSGNLGVGKDAPEARIHVVSKGPTGFNDPGVYIDGPRGNVDQLFKVRAAITPSAATDADTRFIVMGDGKVGVGTATPGARLHVVAGSTGFNDTGIFVDGHSGTTDQVFKVRTSTPTTSATDADTKFIVMGTGKVGIGTDTPGQTLDVQGGNINASGDICSSDGTYCLNTVGAASGENNTASNQGAGGVGLYKTKSGADLQFKNINAGSNKVTVTNDAGNNEVDIDIAEANIDHDSLSGFVANEHVDHSSVNVATAANSGLSGGGDLTATRNLAVDISGTGALGAAADNVDSLLLYDSSATALKKVTRSELVLSEAEVDAFVADNGYVTSVTASAPLASSGGATPNISLSLGNGIINDSGDLAADIGTAANQVMGADAVPNCLAGEKLQMSLGPAYAWSCVADPGAGIDGHSLDAADGSPADVVFVDNSGNVGVRDTTPDARLEISADGVTTGSALMISSNDDNDGDLLTVKDDGNLGLGTSAPGARIHIDGGSTTGLWITPDAIANDYNADINGAVNNGTMLKIQDYLGTGANGKFLGLTIASLNAGGYNQGTWFGSVSDASPIKTPHTVIGQRVGNNQVERLRIDNTGKVGIATSSPSQMLDVQGGNINASGDICSSDGAKCLNSIQLSEAGVEGFIANDISTNSVPYDNGTKLVDSGITYNGTGTSITGHLGVNKAYNSSYALDVTGRIRASDSLSVITTNNSPATIQGVNPTVIIKGTTVGGAAGLHFYEGTGIQGRVLISGASSNMYIDADTIHLRQKSGGNGNVQIKGSGTAGQIIIQDNTNGTDKISLKGDGDSYFNGGGNIGIGTTNPGAKLEISGTATGGLLKLNGGDTNVGANSVTQVAFGYNGTDDYPHFIATRHNSGIPGRAIDFYTNDGTQNGVFPTNAVHGLSIDDGKVGIGTTAPQASFQVGDGSPVGETWWNSYNSLIVSEKMVPAVDDDHANFMSDLTLDSTGATGQLNASVSAMVGIKAGNANNFGTTIGSRGVVLHRGAGTISNARGLEGTVENWSTGQVTEAVGVQAGVANVGGGTVSDAIGVRVGDFMNSSGTMTNTYGVYVGDVTEGTQTNTPFSFYASDASALNYFAGNVGIGTTSPTKPLEVQGDVMATSGGHTAITIKGTGSTATVPGFAVQTVDQDWRLEVNRLSDGSDDFSITDCTGGCNQRLTVKTTTGHIGIGMASPQAKLHVNGSGAAQGVCVTSDGVCGAIPTGGQISAETTLNTGADYAEYFEAEEAMLRGDLVGLNVLTGKVRRYLDGDMLIGIVSTNPGVVGNSDLANSENAVLVALVGQVPFAKNQVYEVAGKVYTRDHKPLGFMLSNGYVYVNISSADEMQNRSIASLQKATAELKAEKDREISELRASNSELRAANKRINERFDALEKLILELKK